MVPAGEPWLEMEGTLVSRNFRRSVLHRPPGRRLQQLLYLLLPELREEDGTVAARVFTTWNQE
jgi:hypothetical protein